MSDAKPGQHGPLPGILLVLTILTGVVDAVSYVRLGHVFVANMTGNVVFLGFAAAGARDVAASSSLTAIVSFLVGAFLGGRMASRLADHRGRILLGAMVAKLVLILTAVAVAAMSGIEGGSGLALVSLLAASMGMQNAAVRKINVPDLTTTVLTLTLTGIAADSTQAGGTNVRLRRRLASVAAMAFGAFAGGLLALRIGTWCALMFAVTLAMVSAAVAARSVRQRPGWATAA